MPRAPGRIVADGDRYSAEGLVAALRAAQEDEESAESLTHPFHSYPAKLHPATARILAEIVGQSARRPQAIVDPFCGSGTTLVEIRAAGMRAVGVDLNPLAVLVSKAKTWTVPPKRRRDMKDIGHAIAGEVLLAGKAARRSGAEAAPMRKPQGFDPNARNRRLAAWFAPHVRRELELLAWHIDEQRERDAEIASVLNACLSAILYKVSSRASDTDGSWVERNVPRGAAARHFSQRIELLFAGLGDFGPGDPPDVFEMDARRLGDVVADGTAGGIITSPPYAGTYDYAEHQRLRFDFLALRHRDMDTHEIGSRRSFETNAQAERGWRTALREVMDTITRALAPGAAAAIVIGDSVTRTKAHYALDNVREALTGELVLEAWASQQRPMLGGVERQAFGSRPKAEHILLLRKT